MGKIKFDHRGLCFQNDCVIKQWRRNFPLDEWWNIYDQYQTYDERVVKVHEINLKEKYFVMEKLTGLDLKYDIDKLNFNQKKFILQEVVDIFSKFFSFTGKGLHREEIFFHVDYRLSNFLFINDKSVKLVDPDSFEVVALDKGNNVLHFGRYLDCLVTLKEQILIGQLK